MDICFGHLSFLAVAAADAATASLPAFAKAAAANFLATADARDRASERCEFFFAELSLLFYFFLCFCVLPRLLQVLVTSLLCVCVCVFFWIILPPPSVCTEFRNHQLPLARIKKIMKSDEDVKVSRLTRMLAMLNDFLPYNLDCRTGYFQ
jgi:hypothetical protein